MPAVVPVTLAEAGCVVFEQIEKQCVPIGNLPCHSQRKFKAEALG